MAELSCLNVFPIFGQNTKLLQDRYSTSLMWSLDRTQFSIFFGRCWVGLYQKDILMHFLPKVVQFPQPFHKDTILTPSFFWVQCQFLEMGSLFFNLGQLLSCIYLLSHSMSIVPICWKSVRGSTPICPVLVISIKISKILDHEANFRRCPHSFVTTSDGITL